MIDKQVENIEEINTYTEVGSKLGHSVEFIKDFAKHGWPISVTGKTNNQKSDQKLTMTTDTRIGKAL